MVCQKGRWEELQDWPGDGIKMGGWYVVTLVIGEYRAANFLDASFFSGYV